MGKNPQVLRKYHLSDDDMFEDNKTKRLFFIDDKPDFIADDADFDDPFAADWLTAITAAEALPKDATLDAQLRQLTDIVLDKMDICRKKFNNARHFIEKAFPNNEPVWDEFGYSRYDHARIRQSALITFMGIFHATAEKYKNELIAVQYSQVRINEIETFGDDLNLANLNQEKFIGNLPVESRTRVMAYNGVWDTEVNVCTVGKRLYEDNWAKYQRYLLPPGEEDESIIRIKGLITDTTPAHTPLKGVQVEIMAQNISVLSAATGKYHIGGIPDGTYQVVFTKTGYVTQTQQVTITNGVAVELNVQMQPV